MQRLVILAFVLSGGAVVRLISDLGGVCGVAPLGFRRTIPGGLDVKFSSSSGVVRLGRTEQNHRR